MPEKLSPSEKRIKRLEELIAKRKAELVREKGKLSEKARRERVLRLIQMGELIERAGILDADSGFLLGYLLLAQDISSGSPHWTKLKSRGDALLKKQERGPKKA